MSLEFKTLPNMASWMGTGVHKELESIESKAQERISAKARFARQIGMKALLLKDEKCKRSSEDPFIYEIDLKSCWYKHNEKFRSGDKILMVTSSQTNIGTVLRLTEPADRFSLSRLHLPSNYLWYSEVLGDIDVPGKAASKLLN